MLRISLQWHNTEKFAVHYGNSGISCNWSGDSVMRKLLGFVQIKNTSEDYWKFVEVGKSDM